MSTSATPQPPFPIEVYGGVPKKDQLPALRGGAPILVATPGRLNDFLEWPGGDFASNNWRNKGGKRGGNMGKCGKHAGEMWEKSGRTLSL